MYLLLFFVGNCLCLYRQSEIVLKVNADNFEDYVESESKPVILHAYSPLSQQCKDVADQFMKAAEELKEITKFACLQIEKEKELAYELGIKKPNSFYIVRKGQLQQFSGPITSKHIVGLVMNQVLANLEAVEDAGFQYFFKNVIQLNDDNFEDHLMKTDKPWMVLFYSPQVPESKHMIPIWYEAAQNLKTKINFGSVDVTNSPILAKEFDVGGYPTGILLIQEATYYLHYNVHLTPDFIMEWTTNKMNEYDEDSLINEVINQDRYEKCMEKPLCIIIFVPHILDCKAKCRTNLLKILTEVYDKYHDYKWGWLWCQASSQGDLERALDVDGFNIPTAVAVNPKKMKYTTLKGSFDLVHLDDFLQDILMMRIASSDLKRRVRIYGTDPWDGKDPKDTRNHLDYFDVDVKMKDEL